MSGFHGAFATGVASQQGTLTLPDTWFRPQFWDLLMLQLLRPNSSNLPCLYSTFHLEYPLVLSRFYFFHDFEVPICSIYMCLSYINELVTDIILIITSQEDLILTLLHMGSRLFELFSKEIRVKKQPGRPLKPNLNLTIIFFLLDNQTEEEKNPSNIQLDQLKNLI